MVVKPVDLAKIIADGDSETLKNLPRIVVYFITKIIHQKEMNRLLTKFSDVSGVEFLNKILFEFNITIEIDGKENLPENGKCFFASNHPFGVIDGLVLTHTVSQKYGDLRAIANDAFMLLPPMRPLVAAVNVFGKSSKEYVMALDEVYKSNIPITHFPAGEVSRVYDGKVQDSPWQKSFITKAITSERNIVPFFISGQNSRLFYSIFRIRNWFGVKANIELMLLPREMFKKRNKTIKVKIGKPISYLQFDKTKSHLEWAQIVRNQVYELGIDK